MTAMEWAVVAGAVIAIAWVNWYFFIAGRANAVAVEAGSGASGSEPAVATIVVDGGYSPATVRVKAGVPVRLVFDRRDDSSCSEEVVFPDFGIRKYLPTGERTTIEVTPPTAGRYEFMCGMSMLRGTLIAES
jgi:plastocyanin domain-containing protein